MKIRGTFELKVFKHNTLIEHYKDSNLVVDVARTTLCDLLGGVITGKTIDRIHFGSNGNDPTISDIFATLTQTGFTTPSKQAYFVTTLVLADATNFTVGGDIVSNGTGAGNGIVLVKDVNTVTVKVESGYFITGDNVDNIDPYVASETTISSITSSNSARFDWEMASGENNGTFIREYGLIIDNATLQKLFARKVRDVIEKDSSTTLTGSWTINFE